MPLLDDIPDVGFPDPRDAPEHGLLAVGGTFSPTVLLDAYRRGIFPWPNETLSHAWYSPDPRFLLFPDQLHISRSLRKTLRHRPFEITFDTAFAEVVAGCARAERRHQEGTWISDELQQGFLQLHELGYAHAAEAWHDGILVGGVYGMALGGVFCGESMFATRRDASKVAFVHLIERLRRQAFHFVDCQVHSEHLERFGAREVRRDIFLDHLERALRVQTRVGPWESRLQPPPQF